LRLGGLSEYARTTEPMLARKPKGISHLEAGSLGCVALTALQCLEKMELHGGVKGKTVLITSGRKSLGSDVKEIFGELQLIFRHQVGGVGSLACQLAKNVFGAAKVITTVSTEKVGKVDKLLGNGVVDQSLLPPP
jgi:NADPH:quinone reductase-like Zn-dependent oxidoreductase